MKPVRECYRQDLRSDLNSVTDGAKLPLATRLNLNFEPINTPFTMSIFIPHQMTHFAHQ